MYCQVFIYFFSNIFYTYTMEMKETILALCKKRNTNYSEIARKIGTTKQNICNKFAKNKFYLDDIEKIADALDCNLEINFIDKKNGKPLI